MRSPRRPARTPVFGMGGWSPMISVKEGPIRFGSNSGSVATRWSVRPSGRCPDPSVPRRSRVGDTELAEKFVRHDGRRKLFLDIVRIA